MSAYLQTITNDLYTKFAFDVLDDCQQQGEAAGDQAFPRDRNLYPLGTARCEWWDAGWCQSQDELCGT